MVDLIKWADVVMQFTHTEQKSLVSPGSIVQPSINVVYIGSSLGLFVRLEAYFCLPLCIKHEERGIYNRIW